MHKLVLIFIFELAILQYTSAVCNECSPSNGMACINEKEFNPCFGGKPNTLLKFPCLGENEVCTKNDRVCMNKTDTVLAACGDTTNCGKCEGEESDGKYTCISRTTFVMCSGGELTDIRDTCPKNQMCDIGLAKQGQYPCVPNCKESQIEFCDLYDAIDVPVTTNKVPETTTELSAAIEETAAFINSTTENNLITTATNTVSDILNTTEAITTATQIPTTTDQVNTTIIFAPTPPSVTNTTVFNVTTQNPAELFCAQQTATGRYSSPNNTTCKNYILCFRRGGVMRTQFLTCPNELYFNPTTRICGSVKPNGCI